MTSPLRAARAAFVFLTRIPLGGFPYTPDEWRWAPAYFPLVGAILGGVTGGVFRALQPLGASAAAYVALGVSLLLTGAFHEDGLADTSDALGGGVDRAKVFLILKDSRVGAFGACAVVVSIAGRAALLGADRGEGDRRARPRRRDGARGPGLADRRAAVRDAGRREEPRRYARGAGAGRPRVRRGRSSSGRALVVTSRVETWRVAGVLVAAAGITAVTAWRYKVRAGGVTGDFLGATEQLCEIAGLAVMAWGAA